MPKVTIEVKGLCRNSMVVHSVILCDEIVRAIKQAFDEWSAGIEKPTTSIKFMSSRDDSYSGLKVQLEVNVLTEDLVLEMNGETLARDIHAQLAQNLLEEESVLSIKTYYNTAPPMIVPTP